VTAPRVVEQAYRKAIPVTDLIEHPDNPRRGHDHLVGESIDVNGFYGAIIVQKSTNRIVAGNTRYRAMVAAGAKTVPAFVVDVDDDEARRIMLTDNRTSDLARYDDDALLAALQAINETDALLAGTGYDEHDLAALQHLLTPPDLDDLADNVGDPTSDDVLQRVTLILSPSVAARLREALTDADHDELVTGWLA